MKFLQLEMSDTKKKHCVAAHDSFSCQRQKRQQDVAGGRAVIYNFSLSRQATCIGTFIRPPPE